MCLINLGRFIESYVANPNILGLQDHRFSVCRKRHKVLSFKFEFNAKKKNTTVAGTLVPIRVLLKIVGRLPTWYYRDSCSFILWHLFMVMRSKNYFYYEYTLVYDAISIQWSFFGSAKMAPYLIHIQRKVHFWNIRILYSLTRIFIYIHTYF